MYAIWIILVFCVLSVADGDLIPRELHVPWLPAPVWKDFPVAKGLNHHRIPLGIILAPNEILTCFLNNSHSLDEVRVRLLNDDSKTEGIFKIKNSQPGRGATFRVSAPLRYVSVPFVDGEYLKNPPRESRNITLFYPSDSKILPIYHFGDSEEKFFQLWDTQDAEFAYIESDYFGLLIPKKDKEATRHLPDGKHLDDLIVFYDKILTIYSQLVGLSINETGTNQNVRNRFFLKADKSGPAMAYYSDWCTAVSSNSIESFWLDISPTNWGALHEIGHGHELTKLKDETLSVVEVWNNILAFFYQTIMFGKEMVTKGSKQRAMKIVQKLQDGTDVKSWGLLQKLSFLVHMFFKAGQESFARFNQLTRQELAGTSYYASETALLEKLMHFFAIDFNIDVYPFMKLAKAAIGEEQLIEHYCVLSSVAYPLNYLISDPNEMNIVKNKLNLLFETSLVTPLDLSSTKMKNDFTVKIDHQIFDVLSGDMLKMMDGSRVVVENKILSQTIVLKDIPIGVYKVFVEPNPLNVKFVYDDFYAVVHASKPSELFLSAKIMETPLLLPDKIKFLGLGDDNFASLSAEPLRHVVRFNSFRGSPHGNFRNEKYFSVTVKNERDEVLFNKSSDGNSRALGLHDINMEGELKIEIYHAEPSHRLKTDDPAMDEIIDHASKTNYLILNERGFQTKKTSMKLLENSFLKKIEFTASKIRRKISLYEKPYCQPKYNLLLAVEAFERLFRNNSVSTSLRDQYKDCLPPSIDSENSINTHEVSNNNLDKKVEFQIERVASPGNLLKFQGKPDHHIATLYLDLNNDKNLYRVFSPESKDHSEDEVNISANIRKEDKEIVFRKKIIGRGDTQ